MPQVDLVTFYPIVLWTFIIFIFGALVLHVTSLFSFINETKGTEKIIAHAALPVTINAAAINNTAALPTITA